jgi:outer membrane protein OmpA-like peptidoglycan-associated protein
MMRLILRGGALLALVLLLVPAGFAKSPVKSKAKRAHKKTDDTSVSSRSGTKADEAATPEAKPVSTVAFPAQQATDNKYDKGGDYKPAPKLTPMLATTGTIGLFTAETADTLPKGGFAFSVYGNKFGRMPGSVTLFQLGLDFSYGITDRLNLYGSFVPYGHTHIGNPCELSLALGNNPQCPQSFSQFPNTIYPTLPTTGTPGYVEDFPFAANNHGGVGEVTFGLKLGLLSERRGAPFSLSVRNDFIFPTWGNLQRLLDNGTQSGQFNDMVSLAVSKQWSNIITATWDVGYRFTRDPRGLGSDHVVNMADQFRTGAGFILFPESRIQPMAEYTAVVFTGLKAYTTPNTTFGARDPVDGVWGLRMYPWKNVAFDLGYRYMLNLKDPNNDHQGFRHGFVVKLGTGYWPEKAPPVNHSPTAACSVDKSMVYLESGDTVAVSATASDPDSDPLTYTWSASGGRVDGNGPQVRWLSAGTAAGNYTVTLHVDDGRGGAASCSTDIRVEPKPNRPPVITCSADRSSVFAGERVHITTNASDPDGDRLTYAWRANSGQVVGSGTAVDFDTTGLAPGTYTVAVRVDDGRGGAADCSTTIEVKPVPPPPQASKISECAFGKPLSARIDNICKRILDDVALRLQSEPRATALIIGYSDSKERSPEKLAGDRATNAVKYFGEKGIDASRVATRTGSGQAGADQQNRRIDVIWVPEGATY